MTVEVNDLKGFMIGRYDQGNKLGAKEFTLDLSDLDAGIYLLKIYTGGLVYFRKVVIY